MSEDLLLDLAVEIVRSARAKHAYEAQPHMRLIAADIMDSAIADLAGLQGARKRGFADANAERDRAMAERVREMDIADLNREAARTESESLGSLNTYGNVYFGRDDFGSGDGR